MLLALAGAGLVTALPPARSEALRLLHLSREPLSRQAAVSLSAERERRPAGAADALAPIGVLYPAGESVAAHFCTGEVVDSPRHDLVVTAAHCLAGVGAIRFAPGYRRGRTPFGTWAVVASFVDSAWRRAADPDHDFAFLVVAPRHGVEIQALTGAERIGEPGGAIGASVRVTGYPEGDESPITCASTLRRFDATQLEFDCNGYLDGTSGSAFLQHIDPATGLGTIVGVIGGFEQGGDDPQVSYAAAFGPAAMALYRSAEQAG